MSNGEGKSAAKSEGLLDSMARSIGSTLGVVVAKVSTSARAPRRKPAARRKGASKKASASRAKGGTRPKSTGRKPASRKKSSR